MFIFLFLSLDPTLTKLCSSAFPQVSLRFIFQSGRQLSSFFPFKDRIPMLMRSLVVYKYTRQCCGALYFGQTWRYLYTCISEHVGVSPLTGKKLTTTSISPLFRPGCHPSSNFELLIRESLLISKFKLSLNENISSTPLSLFHLFPAPCD